LVLSGAAGLPNPVLFVVRDRARVCAIWHINSYYTVLLAAVQNIYAIEAIGVHYKTSGRTSP
jgi:hypothetical protein